MTYLRKILLSALFIVLSGALIAQSQLHTKSKKAIGLYREASTFVSKAEFSKAIPLLEKAINIDEGFIEAYLRLSEAYLKAGRMDEGFNTYRNGLDIDPEFYTRGYYNLAVLQYNEGVYQLALENLQKYKEYIPESKINPSTGRYEQSILFAISAMDNPVDFSPVCLGSEINTVYNEYWPSLSADEQTMVFTRAVPIDTSLKREYRNRQEDFYMSQRISDNWSEAKSMGKPLNTVYNEGAQTISANGRTMVYTVCNREGVVGRCDLYISTKRGDKWTPPKNMGRNINTPAKETQPSLSFNGRTLYFASDRSDSRGKLDIYKSTLNDEGIWSLPENLGDSINSPGDEMSPFIHNDNKTLYFSSDYHTGLGKSDLFMTVQDSNGWSKPRNLGYPINTNGNEIGLIVNAAGNRAYFATSRDKTRGQDIYYFDVPEEIKPEPATYLKGSVFDAVTNLPVMAEFEIIDLQSQETINKSEADDEGKFLMVIPTNHRYLINVSKPGYLFFSSNISLEGVFDQTNPFLVDIPLQPIREGVKVVLENVFFETDQFDLLPDSKAELNKIVAFLQVNKGISIEISGHTDNVGNADYNQSLSEKRANTVAQYLMNAGIDPELIAHKGYGFTQPIADNDTEEGRARNRRTELKIIKISQ